MSGKASIQSTISAIMNSGITGATLSTIEVWGKEDFVTEEGEYTLSVGDTQVDKGKYMVLWKMEEGKWKFHRDIFNSDLPAE